MKVKFMGYRNSQCFTSFPIFMLLGVPQDIAHDMFEGVVGDVIQNVLQHCLRNKMFTLEYLYEQIFAFPYTGSDKVNRPSIISGSISNLLVKQQAVQMRCFLRLLPLMMGHKIPFYEPKWEVLLLLLDAVELICAPARSNSAVADLSKIGNLNVSCHYFESSHGKSEADGLAVVLKNAVSRAVTQRKVEIFNVNDFFTYCENNLSNVGGDMMEIWPSKQKASKN